MPCVTKKKKKKKKKKIFAVCVRGRQGGWRSSCSLCWRACYCCQKECGRAGGGAGERRDRDGFSSLPQLRRRRPDDESDCPERIRRVAGFFGMARDRRTHPTPGPPPPLPHRRKMRTEAEKLVQNLLISFHTHTHTHTHNHVCSCCSFSLSLSSCETPETHTHPLCGSAAPESSSSSRGGERETDPCVFCHYHLF